MLNISLKDQSKFIKCQIFQSKSDQTETKPEKIMDSMMSFLDSMVKPTDKNKVSKLFKQMTEKMPPSSVWSQLGLDSKHSC